MLQSGQYGVLLIWGTCIEAAAKPHAKGNVIPAGSKFYLARHLLTTSADPLGALGFDKPLHFLGLLHNGFGQRPIQISLGLLAIPMSFKFIMVGLD